MEAANRVIERPRTGRDELNLAEFPLSVIGKRAPGNAKTLHFQDEVWDRSKQAYVPRRLTVTGSDLLGLPTALDDEVLLGCVQLSRRAGFASPRVRFTRYEFLELIGWKRDGKNYQRISESLDRWAGTLIISDKAFWDKASSCWVKDTFNVLDRVILSNEEAGDASTRQKRSAFVWGDFMWNSFQAGNLKELDFDFWISLNSPVSKRIYRLLDKRFYNRSTITFDLHRLAWDKVGLSRNMHTGQIKEKLAPAHQELTARGFCRTKYVKRSTGKWEVVYDDLRKSKKKVPDSEREKITAMLLDRGVENGSELAIRIPAPRILKAIENFDDRKLHGEDLGPGWLGKAITHETGFAFRKGYRTKEEVVAQKREKVKKLQAREARRKKVEVDVARARHDEEVQEQRFRKMVNKLSVEEQDAKELKAIAKAHKAGKGILADHVQKLRRSGEPLSHAGPLRRMLWVEFVYDEQLLEA